MAGTIGGSGPGCKPVSLLDFRAAWLLDGGMSDPNPDLGAAYQLQSPEDNRTLYAD